MTTEQKPGSGSVSPRLSIIIPVLNDAAALGRLLGELASHCPAGAGAAFEVIVVDGGSRDASAAVARQAGARVLSSRPGRGPQLGCGAAACRGNWLWLLHADSAGTAEPLAYLLALANGATLAPAWGRFDVVFDQPTTLLRVVACMMNLRSRMTGICTGDQGLFVHRRLLCASGGVPDQRLMEDIELSRRLKRQAPPLSRPETLVASARRWHRHGVLRTVVSMWGFRLRYWLGADPERLARRYYHDG